MRESASDLEVIVVPLSLSSPPTSAAPKASGSRPGGRPIFSSSKKESTTELIGLPRGTRSGVASEGGRGVGKGKTRIGGMQCQTTVVVHARTGGSDEDDGDEEAEQDDDEQEDAPARL